MQQREDMETDKRSLSLLTILSVCTFGIVASISGLSYSGKMIAAHWNLPISPLVIVDVFSLVLFVTLTLTGRNSDNKHPYDHLHSPKLR